MRGKSQWSGKIAIELCSTSRGVYFKLDSTRRSYVAVDPDSRAVELQSRYKPELDGRRGREYMDDQYAGERYDELNQSSQSGSLAAGRDFCLANPPMSRIQLKYAVCPFWGWIREQ